MKLLIPLVLILLFPLAAPAHPGKTDRYGGHMCLKECEEWNLFYKEYHLHDKYGKPIRVKKERKVKASVPAEVLTMPAETALSPEPPRSSAVPTHHDEAAVPEERSLLPNPLLLVLMILLLLLLMLRIKKRREEG